MFSKKTLKNVVLGLAMGCSVHGYTSDELEEPDTTFHVSKELTTSNCNGHAALELRHVGGDYGSWVYAVNRSGSRAISVTVRTRWVYQGETREKTDIYKLAPGEKKYIGYTRWKNQVFNRDIVGCRYL